MSWRRLAAIAVVADVSEFEQVKAIADRAVAVATACGVAAVLGGFSG